MASPQLSFKPRMAEWKEALDRKLEATDFESKTSALVDEGVRALRNWDAEVKSIRVTEAEEARQRIKEESDMRKQLARESIKIKQVTPADDLVTPRLVISEFEKYMERKKGNKPNAPPAPSKHVKFDAQPKHPPYYKEKRHGQRPRQGQGQTQGQSQGQGQSQSQFLGENYHYDPPPPPEDTTPGKSRSSKKSVKRDGLVAPFSQIQGQLQGQGQSQGQGPLPKNDPAWWRRKIRQGMIQTEMLMTELVKQRRQDEKYFNTFNPYIHGMETYNPVNPFQTGRNVQSERDRLERSMEASKKLHEECFGSCPVSIVASSARSAHQPSTARGLPRPSLNPEADQKSNYFFESDADDNYDEPTSATELMRKNFPRVAAAAKKSAVNGVERPKAQTVVSVVKKDERPKTDAPSVIKNGDEFQVLFERNISTTRDNFLRNGVNQGLGQGQSKSQGQGQPSFSNQSKTISSTFSKQKPQKTAVVIVNKERPTKEWMQDLIDARKAHTGKADTTAQKKVEQQRKATNLLYKELMSNKTRLEREVNFEKRQITTDWQLRQSNHHKKLRHSSSSESGDLSHHHHQGQSQGHSHRSRSHSPRAQGSTNPKPKKKLQVEFPRWKETPKGLSLWLENVMEKAKDEKAKGENMNKKMMVPLSSLRF